LIQHKLIQPKRAALFNNISSGSLVALILLCLLWELWLAPLRPGGSMLALKAVPLLLPLFGVLRGRRYTLQWASMLILVYFIEGAVRATSDSAPSSWLAWGETALTLVFFASAVAYARITGAVKPAD
jgi:uncharacterized membrane protein